MKIHQPRFNQITLILSSFVILILLIMMAQDYLVALIFKTSYVFKESLLFKTTIALLFVSIAIYSMYTTKKINKKINIPHLLTYLVPITIVHILIAGLLISFIAQNFLDSHFSFLYLIKNKFTNDFIFIFTIYGLMYLIVRYYSLNLQPTKQTLSIKTGTQTEIISIVDIDWIAAETPYVGIWVNGKKYLYNSTLINVLSELDNDLFVQIHRSTIVNASKIEKIASRANGDYDISLYDNTQLRLSRNYRNSLKNSQLKF